MKTEKTGNYKYPLELKLENGAKITLPKQSRFDNVWLRKHGCSLMAEYEALQFLGVKKKWWPIYLLSWHKENTPSEVFAKVTIRGVAEGINKLAKGKGSAKYGPTVTKKKVQTALDAGAMVIFERVSPTHTLVLVKDDGQVWKLDAGTVKKSSAEWAAKVATKSKRYRGMVIVRRKP